MFTFGYSHMPPYITYRVISKEGVMQDPVPITVSDPIMMHDFAITENYAIFMDLPLYFRPKVCDYATMLICFVYYFEMKYAVVLGFIQFHIYMYLSGASFCIDHIGVLFMASFFTHF